MSDFTRLDADDRALCRSLRREGESFEAIGEILGCSHTSVRRVIAEGVPPRQHIPVRPHVYPDCAGKIMGGR